MSDVKCPYCGEEVEINHDDGSGYAEDQIHQQECGECEKMFTFTTSIHFSYNACKADCLNGGEHKRKLTSTYPKRFSMLRCEDCGDEIKPPQETLDKLEKGSE